MELLCDQTALSVSQFVCDILPGDAPLYHEYHGMIQEVGDFIFNLLRIRILGCDNDLGRFLSYFL